MAKTQTVEQNTKTEPWGPSQDYLKGILSQIDSIFSGSGAGAGGGIETWTTGAGGAGGAGGGGILGGIDMFTPTQSDWTKRANQMVADMASGGAPTTEAAANSIRGILAGTDPNTIRFNDLYGRAGSPGAIETNLGDYASGKYVNGGSPEFLKALDTQSAATANDIARQFSNAGRYGSAAMTGTIANQVGDARNAAMAAEIAREQANQISAAGMLSGEQMNRLGLQSSILGDQSSRQLSAAGMAPTIDAARYLPAEMLGKVGAGQDAFNWATQQAPYEALKAKLGLLMPIAGSGGTSNTTTEQPYSPFMSMLGGGLGILQLLSGLA